jgi:hypothetical protein
VLIAAFSERRGAAGRTFRGGGVETKSSAGWLPSQISSTNVYTFFSINRPLAIVKSQQFASSAEGPNERGALVPVRAMGAFECKD